jgi:hypothetical protein
MHQVLGNRFWSEPPTWQGFEQRRNLRRKYDGRTPLGFALTDRVVQRFDTKAITNQPSSTTFMIPQRHREHSSQSTEGLESFVLIQVDQDFGITASRKSVPSAHKLLPQLSIVIDLAIHDSPNGTSLVSDWLLSPVRIDYPKSSRAKRDTGLTIDSLFVRSTMDQTPQHWLKCRTVVLSYDPANAAHPTISPFQARYGLGVPVLAVHVHAAEIPMKVARPPVHIECA